MSPALTNAAGAIGAAAGASAAGGGKKDPPPKPPQRRREIRAIIIYFSTLISILVSIYTIIHVVTRDTAPVDPPSDFSERMN
jgi:hypothetical protein